MRSMPRPRRIRFPRKGHRRRWLVLAGIGVIAFLYYKPFTTYMSTRHAVAERRTQVANLRAETRVLQRRLASSASVQELERQARGLGYVKRGERLFIVKGISAWKRAHGAAGATIARNG